MKGQTLLPLSQWRCPGARRQSPCASSESPGSLAGSPGKRETNTPCSTAAAWWGALYPQQHFHSLREKRRQERGAALHNWVVLPSAAAAAWEDKLCGTFSVTTTHLQFYWCDAFWTVEDVCLSVVKQKLFSFHPLKNGKKEMER